LLALAVLAATAYLTSLQPVPGADPELGAATRQVGDGRHCRRAHRGVPGHRIADRRQQTEPGGRSRAGSHRDVQLAVHGLAVDEPEGVEAALLGQSGLLDRLLHRVMLGDDPGSVTDAKMAIISA